MQLVVCSYDILCRHFWKFVELQDHTQLKLRLWIGSLKGSLRSDDGYGNDNVKITIGWKNPKDRAARAARIFEHFSRVFVKTTAWND